jgi:exodeoxyribonuclease V beta subunit
MTDRGVVEKKNPTDWTELSLRSGGRSLIEASAGTGKTWTISVLYLRLLLEQGFSPKQIVVTTFTDAAAQELRERIRGRLLWAEQRAKSVLTSSAQADRESPDEQWLQARWRDIDSNAFDPTGINADLNRLRLASAELDLAPIGTLHSLCRKILTDYPFESGSTFDLGDMVSTNSLMQECANDFWRRLHQDEQSSDGEGGSEQVPRSLQDMHARLKVYLGPGVMLQVPDEKALRESLTEDCASRIELFSTKTDMYALTNGGKPQKTLSNALTSLVGWIRDPTQLVTANHRGTLAKLQPEFKPEFWQKLSSSPELRLLKQMLSVWDQLASVAEARTWHKWIETARTANQQRLADAGQLTFDELIERVYRALSHGGSALADRLFEAWPVALVDEFQDTDAQQFAILDRIYCDDEKAHRGRLVMIGDPKQAIYRFRGGDIDAYLEARKSATGTLTLDTNFRSSRQLVNAFNAFYARAGEKLSSNTEHEICYEAVKPSGRCDAEPYRVKGEICEQPLQFHYWASVDVPDDAPSRTECALEACANHIVALLSGEQRIGDKPIRPGDIAVLLPSNAQITTLRDLLSDREVPCVSSAKSSVFGSDWARELQIILYAALHPRDEGAVRAALATRLGGKTYNQLRDLRDQPEDWQREASVFALLDHLWQTRGVLALVQQVTSAARSRLFARDDSERVLTDLRHLGELLQARSEELTGREQLLTWLADQRDDEGDQAGDAADEMQLRIESDAARVRLMTLHSSKGLEFPIVLLPLMWANKHNSKDTITVLHDPASGQRVVAFGAEAKQRYQQEGQDERFRLLYVALTRARYACHVYALSPSRRLNAKSKDPDTDPIRAPLDAMIERLLKSVERPDTMEHVLWSIGPWPWVKAKYQPASPEVNLERHVLSEPGTTRFEYKYSFSALAKGGKITQMEERAASDESESEDERLDAPDVAFDPGDQVVTRLVEESQKETEHAQLQWLAPIAGSDFGNALHAIFEHRVIGRPIADQCALIKRCMLDEGVRLGDIPIDQLVSHLANRLQATLDTPLLPDSDPTLTLGAVPETALRAEMEFNFVLNEVWLRRLREVCHFVPGTSMQTLRGLMNGKIDLVFEHGGRFHVLDYKGNRLDDGGDPPNHSYLSNYAPARLELTMDHAKYRFQALLYTVAVDRYLRQRMPNYERDKHLGETIYLFVRAVGIAPEIAPCAGIWAHRFDNALIDAVDAVFANEAREAA